jgi:hypothetical protein
MTDLFRAVPLGQAAVDELSQHRVGGDPGRLGPEPACRREPVGGVWQVAAAGRVQVALQLTADRRHRPTQLRGDKPHAVADAMQIGDPDTFLFA